jgi:hypothetical protein
MDLASSYNTCRLNRQVVREIFSQPGPAYYISKYLTEYLEIYINKPYSLLSGIIFQTTIKSVYLISKGRNVRQREEELIKGIPVIYYQIAMKVILSGI